MGESKLTSTVYLDYWLQPSKVYCLKNDLNELKEGNLY